VAIVFILWIRIALRVPCTTTSPALGARRVATQERAVDMDSNASRAGEVERKVWQDNDFLLPGKLLKMSPLVDGQFAVSTQRKWRQRRRVATGIRATALLAERANSGRAALPKSGRSGPVRPGGNDLRLKGRAAIPLIAILGWGGAKRARSTGRAQTGSDLSCRPPYREGGSCKAAPRLLTTHTGYDRSDLGIS
jgi:hypothetical protein